MATQQVLCKGVDSSNNVLPLRTDADGKLELGSTTLPTGAATATLQTSGNASLSTIESDTTSIDSKTPSLGQALESASVPVVIASDQPAITVSSTQSAASSENTLSILAGATNTSVSKDTAGYSKVGVVIDSDQTDTTVQLKWSHDNVTYYPVEEPSATTSTSEIGGGSAVNTLYFIVSPVAKYVRLDVKATTAASVKALVNLH